MVIKEMGELVRSFSKHVKIALGLFFESFSFRVLDLVLVLENGYLESY